MGNKFYVEMHLRHRRITSVLKQFAFKVISGLQFYQELAKIISKKLLLYLIHNFNTFERNHHIDTICLPTNPTKLDTTDCVVSDT